MIVKLRKYDEDTAKALASEYGGYTRLGDVVFAVGDPGDYGDLPSVVNPVEENYELSCGGWIIIPFLPEQGFIWLTLEGATFIAQGRGGWINPETGELEEDDILLVEYENPIHGLELFAQDVRDLFDQEYVMFSVEDEVRLLDREGREIGVPHPVFRA